MEVVWSGLALTQLDEVKRSPQAVTSMIKRFLEEYDK